MASLVYVDRSVPLGRKSLNALGLINQGIHDLEAMNGARGQLIGTSQAAMKSGFGTDSNASAQAYSDRIATFLAAQASDSVLHDLLDATIDGTAPL